MRAKVSTLSLDVAELGALLERIQPVISAEDHARLTAVVSTLIEVTRLSRQRGATIARLRRMLGQTSSEKTANVVDAKGPAASTGDSAPTTSGQEPLDVAPADEATPKPANDAGGPTTAGDKPRRKGHGRIAGSAYQGTTVAVPHPTLGKGMRCPACAHGSLYELPTPSSTVRIFGQPPLVALRWNCECLRCNGCQRVFTAPLPEQARGPKHDETAAAVMVVLRYGMGMPLHRLETMQQWLGVPVPASTQWEIAKGHLPGVLPVYNLLAQLAANAPVLHNDDTYVRILALMGKRRIKLVAAAGLDLPDRTGLFTTGIVACTEAGPIALFASGRQHAGENLADLLDLRDPALGPPIQMCDGLDRNLSADHLVELANCLAHARRHVVDEVGDEPDLCAHVLREIGKVFKNDETCRADGLSGEARLAFHQGKSREVMAELRTWIEALFTSKRVEPNSGLGGALRYMLSRWESLTLFLRVADAPIDNNAVERVLKHAIRHRRASLFYLTRNGARVGDIYTSLIVTTVLHRGDPIRYLTALFANETAVASAPADWLPWTYERTLARREPRQAAAA
jgi:transposase